MEKTKEDFYVSKLSNGQIVGYVFLAILILIILYYLIKGTVYGFKEKYRK